eukprot:TRINITY_DN12602_c0_g1_i1.p1 TRINITY_DN12602_c0_g1~~TRINITY_DN12602_c0_g1_i1.p1  ORF type:complete len:485 (+),score=184.58 TRINITY_DN12602_c0_g1_i1:226-1680(+)
MGKKKKFIDKKTALNFEVVHRDQRDPLTADDSAPQMLLKEVDLRQKKKVQFAEDDDEKEERRRREYAAMKAALRNDDYELGAYAFPSDGYDYGQHLREGGGGHFVAAPLPKEKKQPEMVLLKEDAAEAEDAPVVMLPAEMFASEQELSAPVGTLRNKPEYHGINLEVDPDIMAALDGDEGFEEILDDFIVTAQDEEDCAEDDGMFELTDCFGNKLELRGDEYDSDDSDVSGEAYSEDDYDNRTEYTMTTSRRERGEQGRILDDRFEQFVKDEYDSEEIGEPDEEDTNQDGAEATLDNALLAGALDDYIETCADGDISDLGPDRTAKPLTSTELQRLEEANNTEHSMQMGGKEPEKQEEEWDCETIVSTYSNLYNHPKALDQPRIRISSKTGLALGFLPDKYNKKQPEPVEEEDEEEDEEERVNLGVKRRGESKEEKKLRKAALKDEKRTRRAEKKDLKNEFKKESELQKREAIARGPALRIKPL